MSIPLTSLPLAVQRLHAFEGMWTGHATIEMAGTPVLNLTGYQKVSVLSDGWCILIEGKFTDQNFLLNETIMGSYDALSDKIIWAVSYNMGPQSFSVSGDWSGDALFLSRSQEMNGLPFEEKGSWEFKSSHHRILEINSSLAGQFFGRITADVTKS